MKYIFSICLVLSLLSCQLESIDYSIDILKDGMVDTSFVDKINEPGRMLLGWYLFAYGNECSAENDKPKCKILHSLDVDNECDTLYVEQLRRWFKKDVYRNIKLRNCPSLPLKGAIQNEFQYITLERSQDTLSISFRVDGMNNSQEKSWNVERVERFLLVDSVFLFLE